MWWAHNSIELSPMEEYRIHPDDEHLQYGPISTALREQAKDGDTPDIFMGMVSAPVMGHYDLGLTTWLRFRDVVGYERDLHRSLFLLILAEALADEGL